MASSEDISRIAKILARATSSEPGEAEAALQGAYKRMRRDNVGVRDLLTLPLSELYQDALVKLIFVILDNQPSLSPGERRKAFERFMGMISDRFAAGEFGDERGAQNQDERDREAQEAREAEERRRRAEDQRARDEQNLHRQREQRAREQAAAEARRAEEAAEETRRAAQAEAAKHAEQRKAAPQEESGIGWAVALVVMVVALAWAFSGRGTKTEAPAQAAKVAPEPPAPTLPILVVAAQKANLRISPSATGKPLQLVERGGELTSVGAEGTFFKIQTSEGGFAFVAQDLVIPKADYIRLSGLSPQQYLEARAGERRIEKLFQEAEGHLGEWTAVLASLEGRSDRIGEALKALDTSKRYSLIADPAAGIWFSLAVRTALEAGDEEQALWNARAAVESDPSNVDHHVALALAAYKMGQLEKLGDLSRLLPRLSPFSTNAWMIFGLANALDESADENMAKSSFVLAARVSRNPATTRKYLQKLAEDAPNQRLRLIIYGALADESSEPRLFDSARTSRPAITEVAATLKQ